MLEIKQRVFKLTPKKYVKLQMKVEFALHEFQKRRQHISKLDLLRVLGYLQSTTLVVPNARENLVMLYADLHKVSGWKGNEVVTILVASSNRLKFFLELIPIDTPKSWGPPMKVIVYNLTISTDASKFAWGAYLHAEKA